MRQKSVIDKEQGGNLLIPFDYHTDYSAVIIGKYFYLNEEKYQFIFKILENGMLGNILI